MNKNAFNKKSSIKVTKTQTGGLHDSVGFPGFKGEGYVQPLEEQLNSMAKNDLNIDRTKDGIIITPKIK